MIVVFVVFTYEGGGVGEDQSRGGRDAVRGYAHEGEQLARLDDQQHPHGGRAWWMKLGGQRGMKEMR